jgi:hypothetical protein
MDFTVPSPPNPLPDPVYSNCGGRVKMFFGDPRLNITQESAPIFDFNASTTTQESLFTPLVTTSISAIAFTRNAGCTASGQINFTSTNYTGESYLKYDLNNDGDYNDPIDKIDTIFVVNGINNIAFNGLDGLGNIITASQNIDLELSLGKKGEVHFTFKDVEKLTGGIEVVRLNGSGFPDYTLYWDDSKITSGVNCSYTSLINGSAGINSLGGVHG